MICSHCNEPGAQKRCSRCKCVYYCSAECQRRHWSLHRSTCCVGNVVVNEQQEVAAECAICLDTLPIGDVERLPCRHAFCGNCIGEWRNAGSGNDVACPLCRCENAMHRVYLDTSSEAQRNILTHVKTHFRGRIAPPSSLKLAGRSEMTVCVVPESLLVTFDAQCRTASNGNCKRVAGLAPPGSTADQDANNQWHLVTMEATATSSSAEAKKAALRNDPIVQRVTRDPRFARLAASNGCLKRSGILCLHRRIEEDVRAGRSGELLLAERETRTAALVESRIYTAICSGEANTPVLLYERFGEQLDVLCSRIPRLEVVLFRSANHVAARAEEGGGGGGGGGRCDEREARFMIVYNRLHNSICNCCWLRPSEASVPLRCCAHCEITFYCSLECAEADWPSHSQWCCQPDAEPDDGPLKLSLAQFDEQQSRRITENNISVLRH